LEKVSKDTVGRGLRHSHGNLTAFMEIGNNVTASQIRRNCKANASREARALNRRLRRLDDSCAEDRVVNTNDTLSVKPSD
jgi:predicted dienelactone hydrolase